MDVPSSTWVSASVTDARPCTDSKQVRRTLEFARRVQILIPPLPTVTVTTVI